MKVYILEKGCYEDRYIAGIYATAELAMAAHPTRPPNPEVLTAYQQFREGKGPMPSTMEREGGWRGGDGQWSNGLDWEDAATITEYDVIERLEGSGE